MTQGQSATTRGTAPAPAANVHRDPTGMFLDNDVDAQTRATKVMDATRASGLNGEVTAAARVSAL